MTTDKFTQYKSGVFFDVRCSNHTVDHAIVSEAISNFVFHCRMLLNFRQSWATDRTNLAAIIGSFETHGDQVGG